MGFDQDAVDVAIRGPAPGDRGDRARRDSLLLQAIPLLDDDKVGRACCVLLRDVTDLRRRDRLLLSKDATIREIHHRVKNNLQTIASLLRLQGRRLQSPEAQAGDRGVGAPHPLDRRSCTRRCRASRATTCASTTSCGRWCAWSRRRVTGPDRGLRFAVEGDAGELPGELATPLAVVLNELMQNAVDHAFPAATADEPTRHDHGAARAAPTVELAVDVVDDGVGPAARVHARAVERASGCRSCTRW